MKFLLVAVNAKYIHSNPAVYSLRAYAGKAAAEHIELAEYTINQRMQDILADIYVRKPDAIGFSCYIWNWDMIRALLGEVSKLLPEADIWLGGPEATYDAPEILLQFPQITGIMVGEGESTFRELLEQYRKREPQAARERRRDRAWLENIPGLCLPARRAKGENGEAAPFFTPARPLLDLSSLPFPYDDLNVFSDRIIYYESSRGCPYQCSYCLSSVDKKLRLRDIDVVKEELQFFLDNRVKQVKFVDRTFNCDHGHAMEIWRYILEHDNGVTNFHFEIAADILREDEIALLRQFRPGLAQLEIGVQSANPETIAAVQRTTDLERLEQAVAALRSGRNIHLHLDLIAGLPYEDYESFAASFNRVYAMCPEQLQLGFLKVLKGSPIREQAADFGIACMSGPPYEVLYTKWLSYEDVLRLKRVEEMVELYYNSNQFRHTIRFLERAFADPFAMYEKLAAFYEQQGYFLKNPARASRYDALLAFALQYDEKHEAVYRELLTFDMYLRENLKSRPAFAAEATAAVKDAARKFYQAEERERKYLQGYEGCDWKQMSRMTHLEPFRFPVWEDISLRGRELSARAGKEIPAEQPPYYVLFDYREQARDPLTYGAAVRVIEDIP